MDRTNLYLLLELDPKVDDWPTIEVRLQAKKNQWSSDRIDGKAKQRRLAEDALARLPEIVAALKDPAERRKIARDAAVLLQKQEAEKLAQLNEAIQLLKAGGAPITDEQITRLGAQFGGALSTVELEDKLRVAGVRLARDTGSSPQPESKETIDGVLAKQIRDGLDLLGLKTLYDFLELPRHSSPQALQDRARAICHEHHRLGHTDAASSERNKLGGIAERVFQGDIERSKYNNLLAIEAMGQLKPQIELAGADGFVRRGELDQLVRMARERGVAAEDARAFIARYAGGRKWVVEEGDELPAETLRECGFCAVLAPADAVRCGRCGEPLALDCPRCSRSNPSSQAACSQCGCQIGDAPLVRSLLREAEQLHGSGKVEEAVTLLERALVYWPGHEPALSILAKCPPPCPSGFSVSSLVTGFRLRWQGPPGLSSATYRVTRRQGGTPRSANDGEVVGEVQAATLDDAEVPVGVPWFYAVYTLRGATTSREAATSGPHLRIAEVESLWAVAGDGEVTLSWVPPPGCKKVEVWRQEEVPPGLGSGRSLLVSGSSVRDSGLGNGRPVGYRVVALFADPARPREELATPGLTIIATPAAPPLPVHDLAARRTGPTVLLIWTPVHDARVEVRQSTSAPAEPSGFTLPMARADRFGALVPSTSERTAQATITDQGQVWFVPLAVRGTTAVVGRAVAVVNLDPITRLTIHRTGKGLTLTWEWPTGGQETLVTWSFEGNPTSPENAPQRVLVSRREYNRTGCWELPHIDDRRHFFAVFSKSPGAELYAEPARANVAGGQQVCVSYRVGTRKSVFPRRIIEAWVELEAKSSDLALPGLVLVAKPNNVPISPRDGEILEHLEELRFAAGRARIAIPTSAWGGQSYVKLFFREEQHASEIRLLPASKDQLRVI